MLLAALYTVCVVAAGDSDQAVGRLKPLAESVRVVDLGSRTKLDGCDIVVLGSGWAELGNGSWKKVQPRLGELDEFVRGGGGLLVFQPNPFTHPKDTLVVEIVGAPVTFENWYRAGERVRAVREHPLLARLEERELPWPADRITTFDPKWTSLVRGRTSEDVSLLAGEFDCGRAVIDADNPALRSSADGGPSSGRSNHSDAFLRNVLDWLGTRPAGCTPES